MRKGEIDKEMRNFLRKLLSEEELELLEKIIKNRGKVEE